MSRRAILLLIAGVIAAFTAVSVRNRLAQAPVPEAVQPTANHVIIAKHDLAPGSFVQGAQDLDWGSAPTESTNPAGTPAAPVENYLHEGAVKLSDFNGAVVRRQLHAGEAVPSNALMKSGEGGFMSAVLNPGMRAVAIGLPPNSNGAAFVAGFISPGDKVDLIVTHRVKTHTGEGNEESVVSETFVRNVRVVAVDQMLDNPDNKAILAKTVTVEVTPRQAEQVAVAAEMGKISVALRSIGLPDPKPVAAKGGPVELVPNDGTPGITDLYGNNPPDSGYTSDSDITGLKSAMVPRVQVIRGDKSETLEFYRDTTQ